MTAATGFVDTPEMCLVPFISALSFPVAAATSLFAGTIGATDSAGRLVPGSASTAIKVWGRIEKTVVNTVAAGFGSAGQLSADVKPGIYSLNNSAGADAIAAADVGRLAYVVDDNTVALTDGAGLRPAAGKIYGLDGTKVKVGLGEPSLYDLPDDLSAMAGVKGAFARNVVNGNVANLAAYTVASNAAVNDATLNVEGDIVLLIAQSTAAQNGLYKVGVVATGTAPLTRIAPMPAGYVFLQDEFLVTVRVGTVFQNSRWFNSAAGTIATDSPAFMPESVTISQALVAGTMTITSIPILSVTKTGFTLTRRIANTSTNTVGGYCVSTGGANGVTAGALGTASLIVEACVAAGTINNADISTINLTVTNR